MSRIPKFKNFLSLHIFVQSEAKFSRAEAHPENFRTYPYYNNDDDNYNNNNNGNFNHFVIYYIYTIVNLTNLR